MSLFLKTCCLGESRGISFVDFTPVRVCKSKRVRNNKVFKSITTTGKGLIQFLFADGLHLIRHIKNNMKNSLIIMSDKILLRKRLLQKP